MNVDYTDEQVMLKESLDRRLSPAAGLQTTSQAERWKDYAEAGYLAIPFAEERGGLGAGPVETMILQEALGKGALSDPYLSSVVVCGSLLQAALADDMVDGWIAAIVEGTAKFSLAQMEPGGQYGEYTRGTLAKADKVNWTINGRKLFVEDTETANYFIVSAANDAGQDVLLVVDSASEGISVNPSTGWDGRSVAVVEFKDVCVPIDNRLDVEDVCGALIGARDLAIAAICAEAVGLMSGVFDLTVEYLKTRRQFKTSLSGFQALRHKVCDMLMALELARSAAMAAASACAGGEESERRIAIARAKVQINRSSRFVAQAAIQLHGGIGLAEEYQLGIYARRLTVIGQIYGNDQVHLRALANSETNTRAAQ